MTSHTFLSHPGQKKPVIKLILATVILLGASTLNAETWSQTAANTYNWNDVANWGNVSFPNGVGGTANISADFAGAQTINLNQAITVGSLTINDTGATSDSAITIAPGTSGTLTMQVSSGNATITNSSTGVTNIISAPVVFASDTTIALGSTAVTQGLTLSGGFSGTGNITVTGTQTGTVSKSNTLNLTGNNTSFTGNWILSGTTPASDPASGSGLNIAADLNLGAVPSSPTTNITVTSGASPAILIASGVTLNANRNIVINSGANLHINGGSTSAASTVAGVISGAGGITADNNASNRTLILSGLNTYTGATVVKSSNLQAGSTSAFGNNSAVSLAAASTAVLSLNGFSNSIGSLAGGGTGQGSVNLGSATLTTGGLNTNTSYAGAIGGTGGLTKVGTGAQTLGGASTYTGTTTLNGGTITADVADVASTSGALGKGGNIIFTGGTLQYTANSAGSDYSSRIKNSTSAISVDTNGQTVTYASAIANTNTGGLTKSGAGTLTLNGASLYTGQTTISAGTLALGSTGSVSSTVINLGTSGSQGTLDLTAKGSAYSLGGTLAGYGTVNNGIGNTLTLTGNLAPGNSPGVVTVTGNLALTGTTTTTMELAGNGGVAGTDYDKTTVSGQITFAGTLNIISYNSYNLAQAGTYHLFTFGGETGDFTLVSVAGTALTDSSGVWSAANLNSNGFDYTFSTSTGDLVVAASIPEPSTYAVIFGALALAGNVWRSRKRRA